MNINRRLESLEQKAGGSEPLIVFFRTFYESKDGGIEEDLCFRASVAEGPYTGTHVVRDGNEPFEDFKVRVRSIANGEISRQAAD